MKGYFNKKKNHSKTHHQDETINQEDKTSTFAKFYFFNFKFCFHSKSVHEAPNRSLSSHLNRTKRTKEVITSDIPLKINKSTTTFNKKSTTISTTIWINEPINLPSYCRKHARSIPNKSLPQKRKTCRPSVFVKCCCLKNLVFQTERPFFFRTIRSINFIKKININKSYCFCMSLYYLKE